MGVSPAIYYASHGEQVAALLRNWDYISLTIVILIYSFIYKSLYIYNLRTFLYTYFSYFLDFEFSDKCNGYTLMSFNSEDIF